MRAKWLLGGAVLLVGLIVLVKQDEDPGGRPAPGPSKAERERAMADGEKAESLRKLGLEVVENKGLNGDGYRLDVPWKIPPDSLHKAMREVGGFHSLRHINANGFGSVVDDEAIRSLVDLDRLEYLSVAYAPKITDAALVNIARFPRLKELHLTSTKTGDAALAEAAKLPRLRILEADDTGLTDAGLASAATISTLRDLRVGGTKATERGIKSLNALRELETLGLAGLPVTDATLDELDHPNLISLFLDGTKITDAGLPELSRFPRLLRLHLDGCEITDAGILSLRDLPSLDSVSVEKTKATRAGVEALKKAKPGLVVFAHSIE